jgi:hypothetical protein
MENYKNHPRYQEIIFNCGNGNYHNQVKRTLKIVLFISNIKLRCHTVKHLMNPEEFEKTWKTIIPIDKELVYESIDNLKSIGCERDVHWKNTPPCEDCQSRNAKKFKLCLRTDFISELENHYIKANLQSIRKGGDIPRYVDYFSDLIENEMFVLMPDWPIVIKATLLEGGTYNLVTSYSDVERPDFVEMRNYEIIKIRTQARKKTIIWCDKNTWEIDSSTDNAGFSPKMKQKKTKKKKIRRPYNRGGSCNWKQYQDESDNW